MKKREDKKSSDESSWTSERGQGQTDIKEISAPWWTMSEDLIEEEGSTSFITEEGSGHSDEDSVRQK